MPVDKLNPVDCKKCKVYTEGRRLCQSRRNYLAQGKTKLRFCYDYKYKPFWFWRKNASR